MVFRLLCTAIDIKKISAERLLTQQITHSVQYACQSSNAKCQVPWVGLAGPLPERSRVP